MVLNRGRMKIRIIMMIGVALGAVALSSCGECSCSGGNSDYLRDVPVTRSQSFR